MGLLKIHFVTCFTILWFQIRTIQSRSLNDEEKVHNISNQTEDADRSSDAQKRVCFPYIESGVPITNYLTTDPENGEQERLVVYFYRTRNSGKLTIYMPSQQKQLLLPDLTYDEGDRFETIVPEQLIDLFHKDMGYFTKIPQVLQSSIPDEKLITFDDMIYVTDLENLNIPINSNQENNEKVVSSANVNQFPLSGLVTTENVYAPINSTYIHDKVIHSNNRNKIMNLDLGNDQHIKNTKTEATQKFNQLLNGQNKQFKPTYNLPDTNSNALLSQKEPETGPITSNIPYRHVFSTELNNQPQEYGEQIGSQHIPVVYKKNVYPKRKESNLGSLITPQSRPQIPSYLLSDDNPKFIPSLESQNQAMDNIPIVSEEEYTPAYQAQNSVGSTVKYNFPKHKGSASYELVDKNPKWIDMSYPNIGKNINSISYLPSEYKHPIFDNWFIKQIKILNLKRPSISKANSHYLKLLLMKALHENGIYMSENGELYDLYGNVFKITNMKLRPILLGNPIDYENLVTNKNFVIPRDISYLEAALVSFGNPPKILALIPLRRIFVTKSHNNVTPLDYDSKFVSIRCGSHECAQPKLSEEPSNQFTEQRYNEDYDETSGLIEGRSDVVDMESSVIEARHNDNNDSLEASPKFEYQNLLPPLSPSFRSKYGENIANSVEDDDIKGKPVEGFDVPHPLTNKPDEPEDYDSLRIRIIGGNPATSSGTPVSSKGRSGLNLDII